MRRFTFKTLAQIFTSMLPSQYTRFKPDVPETTAVLILTSDVTGLSGYDMSPENSPTCQIFFLPDPRCM